MAISTDVERRGVTVPGAYVRAEPHTLNKTLLGFRAVILAAQEEPEAFAVEDHSCAYDIDGENPWKQAYAHLKGLPEFAEAVDC